ncbi:hypothetical protein [Halostella litorea]|uniref:hypothetical protein n=1 Tax=Halostella litorea TaxID=2528831 RepID=UPI001092CCE1|nr:hypothetical protein [Halostella litorea]
MERRKFLAGSGAAISAIVAGCSGDDGSSALNDGETDAPGGSTATDSGGETEVIAETTETAAEAETADETTTTARGEPSTLDRLSRSWDAHIDDPVVLTGEGDGERTFSLGGGFNAIDYAFNGDQLLAQLKDEGGSTIRVINEFNGLGGTDGVPVESGEYTFEVECDGEWKLELGSPDTGSDARQLPPASVEGVRNDVVGPVELSGGETVAVTHNGSSDFIVDSVLESGTGPSGREAVADELSGPYEDETTLGDPGVRWFTVYADASWELVIE